MFFFLSILQVYNLSGTYSSTFFDLSKTDNEYNNSGGDPGDNVALNTHDLVLW